MPEEALKMETLPYPGDVPSIGGLGPFPTGRTFKAIVFDFDGTLAEPTLDFSLMRDKTVEALLPFSKRTFNRDAGIMEEIERFCQNLPDGDSEAARKAAYAAIEEIELEAASRSSLFPFVLPMLEALARNDIPFGVITRNIRAAVHMVFPDLADYTKCLLTREDVERVKPHPEHLQKTFDILGVRASSVLMVGDHHTDIMTGKRAGTLTAGVASGETSLARLAEERPDYLAVDAEDLMRVLRIF
jgi:phosphoglycolate phosphatase